MLPRTTPSTNDSALAHIPPERLTVIVDVPEPVTEEIVGSTSHVLQNRVKELAVASTASEKVTVMLAGTDVMDEPSAGFALTYVGGVPSTVMTALSGDVADSFPSASTAVAAST